MIEVIWLRDVKYVWPGPLMPDDAPPASAHLWTHLALVFPDARLSPRMARVTGAGGGTEAAGRQPPESRAAEEGHEEEDVLPGGGRGPPGVLEEGGG